MHRKPWQPWEQQFLREHYPGSLTEDLAQALGRSVGSVHQQARKLGLFKSIEWIAKTARERIESDPLHGARKTQFNRGRRAWNKGLKGIVGVQEACRRTQFKPGRPVHEAHNYQPIGALRVSKDGYLERKMTDDPGVYPARRWLAEHRRVWEAANGTVPAGSIVVFKPGQKTLDAEQITPDKLECITRRENMLRNTYHRYGPEVAKLVQLRGAITRQINKRSKEDHEQEAR
jgi:hypothetical protein